MGSKLNKLIVEQDIFGHPIHVNYKGRDTYKIRIGALCTLLTGLVILFNLMVTTLGFLD